jgi:hypothetical protein
MVAITQWSEGSNRCERHHPQHHWTKRYEDIPVRNSDKPWLRHECQSDRCTHAAHTRPVPDPTPCDRLSDHVGHITLIGACQPQPYRRMPALGRFAFTRKTTSA